MRGWGEKLGAAGEDLGGYSELVRCRSGSGHVSAGLRLCKMGRWKGPLSLRPKGTPRFPLSPPGRRDPVGVCLLARNEAFGAGWRQPGESWEKGGVRGGRVGA